MDEKYYQTGALSETQTVLISKALAAYAEQVGAGHDDYLEAAHLSSMFGDPEGELIPADKPE